MGHALMQLPIQQISDQRAMIAASLDKLEDFTGKRPVGWLGPGLTETEETPDLLAEAGIRYVGDWVFDDEPSEIATRVGPLVTLPYTVELNDIPMMMVQHHRSEVFFERARDQFDRLYREGAKRAKILCFAIHPYISGVPHRIKYLETFLDYARGHAGVAFWTGEEILDWYLRARER
jgi:allantoinase